MNKEIAHIFKDKLATLPFKDVLAGVAQTVVIDDQGENEVKVTKRFPVSDDTNQPNDCLGGPERILIPNSDRKSIIYFEDFGLVQNSQKGQLNGYTSNLRLICWMNRAKLVGDQYAQISGRAMEMIIQKLKSTAPQNIDMFTTLIVNVSRVLPQDAALFNKYTYTEQDRQYLRPPFEFFGIDFISTFFANTNCLNTIQWNQETCF